MSGILNNNAKAKAIIAALVSRLGGEVSLTQLEVNIAARRMLLEGVQNDGTVLELKLLRSGEFAPPGVNVTKEGAY